jgi:hypothetical protein
MKRKKVYYRVQALPDEIIWLVTPTRKPRKSKGAKEPTIDEDGMVSSNSATRSSNETPPV